MKKDDLNELNENQEPKKIKVGLIALFSIIIIAAIVITTIVVINNNKDEESSKKETNTASTSSDESKKEEKKDSTTKIIAEKETETDVIGKYTAKFEVFFDNGKLVSYKATFSNIKDEYLLNTLKESASKAGFEDKITFTDDSFGYELTGDEFAKTLKSNEILTRNYFVSNFKKQGYTVTIEGDDSFLGEEETTTETTENTNSNKNTETNNSTSHYYDGPISVEEAEKKAKEYLEEHKDEIDAAKDKAEEYVKDHQDEIDAAKDKAEEYMRDHQDEIDAARDKAKEMMKQYGY